MPDISFACPSCQQTLETPEDMAGEVVECPNCQQQMTVPRSEPPAAKEPVAEQPASQIFTIDEDGSTSIADVVSAMEGKEKGQASGDCPECGEAMEPGSVLCVKCGFHTGLGEKISTDLS